MAPVFGMDSPVCLIENTIENGKSKLVANPKALEILSKIDQPVVVVAVVGLYRTGKSYLMNKLAGAQKGFNLGATVQSETKGIWMWCLPHPTIEGHTLVLLDTEGLGDVEKGDNKNDIWLFSLAVLLSSALVYNSKGTIDQDAVDKLKFVAEITEFIKVKAKDNDDEEAELSSHFPIFIWAVRDFHLGLQIDGKKVSEDEYLENALKLKSPAKTMKDQKYNLPRESIRMYFGKRKCFVFPLPTADEVHLQKLEEIDENLLNANFVAQSKKFCEYVFEYAEVKSVKDVPIVTGPRLGGLVKIYTDAISNTNMACMEDAVVSLADKENKKAIEEAIQHYEDCMKQVKLPTETLDDFIERSKQYESEARELFLKKSFKDENQKFLHQFMDHLVKRKAECIVLNEEKSREVCEALIKKHSAAFDRALSNNEFSVRGGHAKFLENLKAVEDKYMKENGKGVKAEEVLQEYKRSKQDDEIKVIQEDNTLSLNEKQEQEKEMKRKCEEMEKQVQQLDEARQKLIEEAQNNTNQETMDRLIQKMEEERKMMAEKMEKVLQDKERERDLYLKQSLQEQAEMFKEQIKDLKRQKEESIDFGILNPIVNPILGLVKLFGGKK